MEQDICVHKSKYSKKTAQTVRNKRIQDGEKYLRIYNCPNCGSWHLTHKQHEKREGFVKSIKPFIKSKDRRFNIYAFDDQ